MKTGKKFWSLLLAVVMVVSLLGGAFAVNAADEVEITPTATYGGETLTMTVTGVNDTFTIFDLASIGYGTAIEYAFWFDADGTFSFNQDVALSYQGQAKEELKAGEVYSISGYSECYVTLDDGNMLALVDSANPGNFGSLTPDAAYSEFPGDVAVPGAAAPAEEPAEEPGEEPAAAPGGAEDAVVYVSISVEGKIVAPSVPVLVSDLDGDGGFNVDEVLTCAHDQLYPGGAAAGYASSVGDWGLAIDMLWGDTSYAFGYYVNNTMAWGLSDPVEAGGSVYAFVYADKEFYTDTYAYFDQTDAVAVGGAMTLTLYAGSFDEDWNVVFAPCAGATITIDGAVTEYVTDENGQVTVNFDEAGSYLISAVSEDAILVPAICKVTAEEKATFVPEPEFAPSATYTVQEGDTLRSIARQFYGNSAKWTLIYEANYDAMSGPSMISVGQELLIP